MIHFVTGNAGKFREVQRLLAAEDIVVERLDLPYPEVQADSLEEVLREAGHWLTARVDGDYLADDSGLFVDSLGGFPGVYSAYAYRSLGCSGILKLLRDTANRRARFESCFLVRFAKETVILAGTCAGVMTTEEKGSEGFGFDPIFVPEGGPRPSPR